MLHTFKHLTIKNQFDTIVHSCSFIFTPSYREELIFRCTWWVLLSDRSIGQIAFNFRFHLIFCRRGVPVPGPFGSHLSAECSQSLGTCPHVQCDICKYILLISIPLPTPFWLPTTPLFVCLLLISLSRINIYPILFTSRGVVRELFQIV